MGTYEKSKGRSIVARAYEKSGMMDLDDKSWVLKKQQAFFAKLTPENQARWKALAYEDPDLCKQAYAEITTSDFQNLNAIVQRMYSNMSTKEFDDMLSQVNQPKGGTENLTNVASPGQPPAKVSATGDGGYGGTAKPIGRPTGGYTDSRGTYSSTGHSLGYGEQPGAFVSGLEGATGYRQGQDNPHQTAQNQYGPRGVPGGTDRLDDYQATKPGNVRPSYTQFPQGKIPSIPNKKAGVSFIKAAGERKDFETKATDDAIYKTIPHSTNPVIELTPNKPNSHITYIGKEVRPLRSVGIVSKKRESEEEGGFLSSNPTSHLKDEEEFSGIGRVTEEDTSLAGTRDGDVVAGRQRQRAIRNEEDQTSVGDNSEYNPADDQAISDVMTNEELLTSGFGDGFEETTKRNATNLMERFIRGKALKDALQDEGSFPQPVKIEEEESEEDERLRELSEEYEARANEEATKGFVRSAILWREKAAKCRAKMQKGTTRTLLRKSLERAE